jgi:predicted TIM-barrel fold metal-dependent hydrolase
LQVCLGPDPNTRAPGWRLPPGACDTHAHVFGPPDLFPYAEKRRYTPPAAPIEHYMNMQRITGLSRAVFVTPTAHGHDNRVILDAIEKMGGHARGIATQDAVNMIVNGFCKEVFKELPMEFALEAQQLLGITLEGSVG